MSFRILSLITLITAIAFAADSTPSDSYKKLAKEYTDSLVAYQKAFQAAKTDAERQQVFRDKHPRVGVYSTKFLALAETHPDSSAAVDALVWVVNHPLPPTAKEAALRGKALELIAKSHPDEEKVGSLCTSLVYSIDSPADAFLRTIRNKARKEPVRARACASLAVNLRHRVRLIGALAKDKTLKSQYESAVGKDVVAALLKQDATALRAECEKLFQEVREKHGEFPHPVHGKLELFARRNLLAMLKPVTPGREAPPITGTDINDKKFTLAEFKGKVVLLDFWSHAFAPCRAMFDYERGLVKRMADKPFVLLGVNGDHDRESLKKVIAQEKITWRSIFDGGATGGPVATRWDVEVWPTVILIDHKGVVRHIFAGWPEPKKLDGLIEGMVKAANKDG